MTHRIRLDDLTSSQLDELYNRLEALEAFTDVAALELNNWGIASLELLRHELAALTRPNA
ncbi:hypothetical protein [Streptomyces abikoensis]|uniref:Uncharacterized protein n=1 Tax=Streptomyces abikoensis TaxID=97398 RepID=A0ABW7TCG3_9ACTN